MAKDGSSTVDAIKSRVDIVDLVGRYLELRQQGGRFVGPCPFHTETKPSFSVNPELGFYYCFGCQASGDVIDFFCRINGLEFKEGLEQLAADFGIEISQTRTSSREGSLRKQALEMHSLAQQYFRQNLKSSNGSGARQYLHKRGVSQTLVEDFGIGWCTPEWQGLTTYLTRKGYKPEEGVQAGLLSKSAKGRIFDRFRSRVIFPIHNVRGQVIAFGGRILGEGEPKYLNSSESPVFKKGEHLFGLFQARQEIGKTKEALLTEGYLDVIALHQHGFKNSCGVLGTALTKEQIRRLTGFCSKVTLLFDGDRAGRQAALRSTEMMLSVGMQCRVALLPEGEDVDSLLQKQGADVLHKYIQEGSEGLDFCFRMLSSSSPRELVAWTERFLRTVQEPALKGFFTTRIAEGLKIPEPDLRQSLSKHQDGPSARPAQSSRSLIGPAQRDREMLGFVIRHPEYKEELHRKGLGPALGTNRGRAFWGKLVSHSPGELLLHLDDGEKQFFISSQLADDGQDQASEQFQEICAFLKQHAVRKRQEELRLQIRDAQESGDQREVLRLLAEYKHVLGEQD